MEKNEVKKKINIPAIVIGCSLAVALITLCTIMIVKNTQNKSKETGKPEKTPEIIEDDPDIKEPALFHDEIPIYTCNYSTEFSNYIHKYSSKDESGPDEYANSCTKSSKYICESESCSLVHISDGIMIVSDTINEKEGEYFYDFINNNILSGPYNIKGARDITYSEEICMGCDAEVIAMVIKDKISSKEGIYNLRTRRVSIPMEYDGFRQKYDFVKESSSENIYMIHSDGIVTVKNGEYGVLDIRTASKIINFSTETISTTPYSNYIIGSNGNYRLYDTKGMPLLKNRSYKYIEEPFKMNNNDDIVIVLGADNQISFLDHDANKLANLTIDLTNQNVDLGSIHGVAFEDEIKGIGVDLFVTANNIDKGYVIYFNNDTIEEIDPSDIGGFAKPILYLYPTKKTNITVKVKYPSILNTTYPKYNNGWDIEAFPNGDLYDKNGNYYYALYWDELRLKETDFKEGFYVTSENAISFLETKLTILGLNSREKNEFIMYWLPILEKNKQSLVYFELTEERQKLNELLISPKPDSLLRIGIHIKKVNKKVSIKEQILPTFNRTGFVAVEWGGTTY